MEEIKAMIASGNLVVALALLTERLTKELSANGSSTVFELLHETMAAAIANDRIIFFILVFIYIIINKVVQR